MNSFFKNDQTKPKTNESNSNQIARISSIASSESTISSNSGPHPRPTFASSSHANTGNDDAGLNEEQQEFLSGHQYDVNEKINPTSESLFRELPHHYRSHSDSNSSTEHSHSRRVALMMASPARTPRGNSSREKQRRRQRSSFSRTANMYEQSYKYDEVQSPLVSRRRTSEVLFKTAKSPHKRRFATQDKKHTMKSHAEHYTRQTYHSEYSSDEFSSESSPNTSPTQTISQRDDSQLSSSGLSRSSKRRESRSSKKCTTNRTDSYDPKPGSFKSPSTKLPPSRIPRSLKTKATTSSNKFCSLSIAFLWMVILSISGMIVMTNRAALITIRQEDSDLFDLPEDSSLRSKQKSKNASKPLKNPDASIPRDKDSNGSQSKKKPTKIREAEVPYRIKIHTPPSASLKSEPKFDIIDKNIYFPSSTFNVGTKADYPPRTVMLDHSVKQISRKINIYPADFTDNTQFYGILPSDDERLKRMEIRDPYSTKECVPMQKWQTLYLPSCNGMHELALETLGAITGTVDNKFPEVEEIERIEGLNATLLGTKGFWRYAWKLVIGHHDHRKAKDDTVVFKNLKYEHNFEDAHFEHDRIDAIAMERLTSSPHVINIFGFCGHSVITEYADGKRLGSLADKAKKTPLKRLEIARDIAHGLADVHGIDGDGNATFVHLDINPANVVGVNNTLKLNDFNIGIIRKWNTTSNKACGFPTQYPNPQWRSPEEARNEQHLTEKVDVFSLGHIFFRLICGHEPWNKLEPGERPTKAEINEKVQRGVLPYIPDHVHQSDDPEIIAIRDIMLKCYKFNPVERPSARDIANTLDRRLRELKKQNLSIPPKKKKLSLKTKS